MDLEYKKYVIFFGIVLIVAGTIACGGKDTVSENCLLYTSDAADEL